MGMGAGSGTGKAVATINVTPMIDVLLVLLIIFMVMVPLASRGLHVVTPQPPRNDQPDTNAVVVQVQANPSGEPSYRINGMALPKSQVEPKLASIFSTRQERVMFVKADESLEYSKIAELIDMGLMANADTVALITPGIEAGR